MTNPTAKRRYNACYRLRKKGVRILANAKTILGNLDKDIVPEVKILMKEYHYVLQTELFE